MNDAIRTIERLTKLELTLEWRRRLRCIDTMSGSGRLLAKLARASNVEQLRDHIAECLYSLIFRGMGFAVEIEPLGRSGPDLRVSRDGSSHMVEVTRFRPVHPGPPEIQFSETDPCRVSLPEYGNFSRDCRKSVEKIENKFRQLGTGDSIIAIWNDENELDELEVSQAVVHLRIAHTLGQKRLPSGLQCILYGSGWVASPETSSPRQFRAYPLREELTDAIYALMTEIEDATLFQLVSFSLRQGPATC